MVYQRTDLFFFFFSPSFFFGYTWGKNISLCFLHCGNDKRGASVIDIYVAVPGLPFREEVETGPDDTDPQFVRNLASASDVDRGKAACFQLYLGYCICLLNCRFIQCSAGRPIQYISS